MYRYRVHGFALDSEFELPGLALRRDGPAQVIARRGEVRVPEQARAGGRQCWIAGGATYVFHHTWGALAVEGGQAITIQPNPELSERDIQAWLLGPGIGVAAHQRGGLVLHASVAALGQSAAAFAGDCGMGKSTFAFALCRTGARLFSDDHAVVYPGDGLRIHPGLSTLRLAPDALSAGGEDPSQFPPVVDPVDKREWRAPEAGLEPARLARVYILADGDPPRLEPLPPAAALMELVRFTAAPGLIQDPESRAIHFRQCTELAQRIPVKRLVRPRDLARLPEAVSMVARDLQPDGEPGVAP